MAKSVQLTASPKCLLSGTTFRIEACSPARRDGSFSNLARAVRVRLPPPSIPRTFPMARSVPFQNFPHRIHLLLNGTHQLKLCPAAINVMTGPMGLKINVALKKIGKKAYPVLQCYELTGKRQKLDFTASEDVSRSLQKTHRQCLEKLQSQVDLRQLPISSSSPSFQKSVSSSAGQSRLPPPGWWRF